MLFFLVRCDELLPSFAEPLPNISVPVGRDVDIPCIIENIGFNRAAWIRVETKAILSIHDHVITRNYRISLSHVDSRSFVLHIKDVEESDSGGYMCQVNTAPMMSQVGYLDVVFPPQIQRENTSSDIITQEGSNVTLTCVAKGYPTPNITWRREDGKPIITSVNATEQLESDISGSNLVSESLNLIQVNRSYNGAYLCIAMNGVPTSVSQRILLQTNFPPEVTVEDKRVHAHLGDTVLLECRIEALPFPNIVWKKENGKDISLGKKYEIDVAIKEYKIQTVLRIRDVQSTDFGIYKCTVNNSLGKAEGEIHIYDIPRPTPVPTFPIQWMSSISLETGPQNDLNGHNEEEENHVVFPKEPRQAAKEESSPLYD
ncbi:protein amalgam-like [Limulus polyphemus]|uniref:Protein amalgam-like n=1 Tax=Limulus polyphemus TaxID=6850 RepID=A0ABM1SPJ4_LIMPO|nr:protein amalgam-like [Limulus polyphemus]